jgi:phosphosulfolactate phosphohydrolase-like enzyme
VAVALSLGFRRIYAIPDLNEAINFARSRGLPLLAEVYGLKAYGADLDNSPSEVLNYGKKYLENGIYELVIRTESGVPLLTEAVNAGFKEVLLGSTVNAKSIANYILSKGYDKINIICAGFALRYFTIEDFIAAGAIVDELSNLEPHVILDDEGLSALYLYRSSRDSLLQLFINGRSGKLLSRTGHFDDLVLASRVNSVEVIPQATALKEKEGALITPLLRTN